MHNQTYQPNTMCFAGGSSLTCFRDISRLSIMTSDRHPTTEYIPFYIRFNPLNIILFMQKVYTCADLVARTCHRFGICASYIDENIMCVFLCYYTVYDEACRLYFLHITKPLLLNPHLPLFICYSQIMVHHKTRLEPNELDLVTLFND